MKLKPLLLLLIVALLLILSDKVSLLNPLKRGVLTAFQPIQIGFNRLSRKLILELTTISEIGRIRDKNRELEYNLALTEAENNVLKKLEEENKILKEQLGLTLKTKKLIQAKAIGFSTIGTSRYLMIDKGADDRVSKDQLVILKDILIGKIESVSPNSSNLLLLTDPEFKVPSQTNQKTKGLMIGQYQNQMRLTKVLPEEKLEIGDIVSSSGEAGFPGGLVLGKIEKVMKNDKEMFQEAVVKPLLNLEKLETVFVINVP